MRPGAARALVCFPHAGGSADFYRPLVRALKSGTAATVVEYPGRGDRRHEPAAGSVEEIAEQVAQRIEQLPGDIYLFGHSLGTLVAYEVAARLRRPPVRLFVSAHGVPEPALAGPADDLADDDLLEHLRVLGGTDERVLHRPWVLGSYLPILRNDLRLARAYRNRVAQRLRCPVTALAGASDPVAGPEALGAWARLSGGPFRLAVLPGGHFYFQNRYAELVRELARDMADRVPVAA